MNRLLEIGFQTAGHWQLVDGELSFDLRRFGAQANILYAFVSDGAVKYVGKTVRPLVKRLQGYKSPGATQSTNIKNNRNIKRLLRSGAAVEILALPDNGLLHYGQFHVNLAAGLEDNIISILQPEWNGKPKKSRQGTKTASDGQPPTVDEFVITLHKTYYHSGFFNVPVAHAQSFGMDGEQIDVYCGESERPITGSINRNCNATHAPRIMGGTGLRDWFQSSAERMQEVTVLVFAPNEIRVRTCAG